MKDNWTLIVDSKGTDDICYWCETVLMIAYFLVVCPAILFLTLFGLIYLVTH